jgi:hypothetical protein
LLAVAGLLFQPAKRIREGQKRVFCGQIVALRRAGAGLAGDFGRCDTSTGLIELAMRYLVQTVVCFTVNCCPCYSLLMQEDWQTLSSIKTSEVARIAAGVNVLKKALLDYARIQGTLRHDSDIDILVDFPSERISAAWRFCEDACRQQGLTPDVRPKSLCSSKFLEKALIGAVELTGER